MCGCQIGTYKLSNRNNLKNNDEMRQIINFQQFLTLKSCILLTYLCIFIVMFGICLQFPFLINKGHYSATCCIKKNK